MQDLPGFGASQRNQQQEKSQGREHCSNVALHRDLLHRSEAEADSNRILGSLDELRTVRNQVETMVVS
jgi:hypothetical protein